MKLLKYLVAFSVSALGMFVIFVYSYAVETHFQCPGEISSNGNSQQATTYIKMEKYRWWVRFWSDSDGVVWLEVPTKRVFETFGHMERIGDDQLVAFDDEDLNKRTSKVYFSSLSNTLSISTPVWSFDGTCKRFEK